MKNTIFYLLISIFISIGFAGCQQVEDKAANIPIVRTCEAENISATTATIYGEVESLNAIYCYYYFLISEDSTFPDDNCMEFYYEEYEPEDSSSRVKAELNELTPKTTYYYVMCATDGIAEVRGDVMSFTTSSSLEIEAVYEADGEPYTGDVLGVYLTDADHKIFGDYGNMEAGGNNTKGYKLPYDFAVTEQTNIYAYTPYNRENSTETLEINIRADVNTDYQYGNSTVSPENPKTGIKMQSAMAKLLITLSIDEAFNDDYLGIEYINLRNTYRDGAEEKLYLEGSLNLTDGSIKPKLIEGHDGIFKYIKWGWKKGESRSRTIEMYVIPTSFVNGELVLAVNTDAGYVEIPIPGSTWEKGNAYEILVSVNTHQEERLAHIGDYYYSDGTWSATLNSSKEPIGIVFALSEEKSGAINPWLRESNHGRIVDLHDIYAGEKYPWATSNNEDVVSLPNFSLLDGVHRSGELPYNGQPTTNETLPYGIEEWLTDTGDQYALTDYNGFRYTDVSSDCTAIWTARSDHFGLDWYLPALGELARLGMACASGQIPDEGQLGGYAYWSSTECDAATVWVYRVGAGNNHNHIVERYEKHNESMYCRIRRVACF